MRSQLARCRARRASSSRELRSGLRRTAQRDRERVGRHPPQDRCAGRAASRHRTYRHHRGSRARDGASVEPRAARGHQARGGSRGQRGARPGDHARNTRQLWLEHQALLDLVIEAPATLPLDIDDTSGDMTIESVAAKIADRGQLRKHSRPRRRRRPLDQRLLGRHRHPRRERLRRHRRGQLGRDRGLRRHGLGSRRPRQLRQHRRLARWWRLRRRARRQRVDRLRRRERQGRHPAKGPVSPVVTTLGPLALD